MKLQLWGNWAWGQYVNYTCCLEAICDDFWFAFYVLECFSEPMSMKWFDDGKTQINRTKWGGVWFLLNLLLNLRGIPCLEWLLETIFKRLVYRKIHKLKPISTYIMWYFSQLSNTAWVAHPLKWSNKTKAGKSKSRCNSSLFFSTYRWITLSMYFNIVFLFYQWVGVVVICHSVGNVILFGKLFDVKPE